MYVVALTHRPPRCWKVSEVWNLVYDLSRGRDEEGAAKGVTAMTLQDRAWVVCEFMSPEGHSLGSNVGCT